MRETICAVLPNYAHPTSAAASARCHPADQDPDRLVDEVLAPGTHVRG